MGLASGTELVSGGPVGFVLGLEGECDREEHGQRKDIPREAVSILRVWFWNLGSAHLPHLSLNPIHFTPSLFPLFPNHQTVSGPELIRRAL